ncbi:MAG: site-specific integrase [Dehalococcoidia bacterium]|nr:site-specific integrase [Dehalococcoidia bacterium]
MSYLPALPGTQIKEYPHVNEREAMAIWTEAKTPRIRCFIKVLWFTGLRISEVLRLTARDVRRVGLDYSLSITRSKRRRAQPELLPVPRELGQSLDDYVQSADLKPSALLFPGHENAYRYQVRELARKAGIENWQKIHPHSFRHGFVYDKAGKGVHPYVLSKLMGHSSLGITLQYYQPSEADLRNAIETK